jgi:hypothetical protein
MNVKFFNLDFLILKILHDDRKTMDVLTLLLLKLGTTAARPE